MQTLASTEKPQAAKNGVLITAEKPNIRSGFGSAVAEVVAEEGLGAPLVRIGMPDQYSLLGPPTHLYWHDGLDAAGMTAVVRKNLKTSRPQPLLPNFKRC